MPSASAVNLAPSIRPPLPRADVAPSDPRGPDFAGLLNSTSPPPPDNSPRPNDDPPPRSPRRAQAGNDDPRPQPASTDVPKPVSDSKSRGDAPADSSPDTGAAAQADGKTDKDTKATAAQGKGHSGRKKAEAEAKDTNQITDAIAAVPPDDAQATAAPQSTDTASALAAAIPGATPATDVAPTPASAAAAAISSIDAVVAATSTTAVAAAVVGGKENAKDAPVTAGPVASTNNVKLAIPNAAGVRADAKASGKAAVTQGADATGTTDSEKVQLPSTDADTVENKPTPDPAKSAQTTDGGKAPAVEHAKAKTEDAPAFDPSTSAATDTPPPSPVAGGLTATAPTSGGAPVAAPAAAASNGPTVPIAGLAVEIASHAKDGNRSFDIRLDPPELGRIHVRLDIDTKGNVTSHLTVDRADTYDLLRRDLSGLERALNEAGLKTGDNSMQFTMRDQGFAGGQQQRQSADFTNSTRVVVPAEADALAGAARYTLPRLGGIDIKV